MTVGAAAVLDPVFIAKTISFAIVVLLGVWAFQRAGKPWLAANQEALNKSIADAEAERRAAESAVAAAQASIVDAQRNAERMVTVAEAQAATLAIDERSKAQIRAKRMLDHADGELDRERNRVRAQLLFETVESAFDRAKLIAAREVDAAQQRRLVDRFVADLEASRRG